MTGRNEDEMYQLYELGPDDLNTWEECWGQNPKSHGRLKLESPTLQKVMEAAMELGHNNFSVRRGGRQLFGWRRGVKAWLDVHAKPCPTCGQ